MAIQPIEATVRTHDGAAVIDLKGEIDASGESALNAAYASAIAGKPALVMLNFSDVTYMNSTGIALIVGLLARARKQKRRLVTFGLSDHYREIFEITRLSDFMTLYASEQAALAGE
jgi:anti-anti-sigma factor